MKTTKIKKQNITKNVKPNNDKYPLKNNKTLAYHKRKNVKQNSSNKLNSKRYSISFIENSISKDSKIKQNNSFDNSLELDYLNFSKIDLFKLNQSFEDDVFTPNNNKRKKRIVEERYEDTISTMNGNSTIIKNDEIDLEKNINSKEKENILNTPSSMCNYYDQSTNKKNKRNFTTEKINKNPNGDIRKNLSQYYNKTSEKKENSNQKLPKNENIKKDHYIFSINCPNILNNDKPSTKYLKQNLKSNSILQKNNNSKNPQISEIDKILKNKENKVVNSQKK